MKLENRVVLVTGSSSGIGAAIAEGIAAEGADVIVNYCRNRDGADRTAASIRQLGRKVLTLHADVALKSDVDAMISRSCDEFGQIDVLVNNAGIALWKPFLEIEEDEWDRTLDTNLKSVFLCSQAVARIMVSMNTKGSIINISSIAAHGALDCLVPYCASKGAMTLITKAMATELAPAGIRVNAIAPGTIDIERNRRTDPDYPANWTPFIPMGRVGTPSEIAKPVVFLASDDSSYLTGQTFWVDGGETSYVPMPRADFARG